MTAVLVFALFAISLVVTIMVAAIVVSERRHRQVAEAKADRFEFILRESIQTTLTGDELEARRRRAKLNKKLNRTAYQPFRDGT